MERQQQLQDKVGGNVWRNILRLKYNLVLYQGAQPPAKQQTGPALPDAGYDFLEGSGFVLEGLEEKGLDAKSYIQVSLYDEKA